MHAHAHAQCIANYSNKPTEKNNNYFECVRKPFKNVTKLMVIETMSEKNPEKCV